MHKFALVIVVGVALVVQAAFGQVAAAADGPAQVAAVAGGGGDIIHVAIFRFAKAHIDEAVVALHELATASRGESGNLGYDIYRSKDDAQEFCIAEHWASSAALAAHEHSEVFIRFGQGVLTRYSTLHDTVTAQAFDVAKPAIHPR